MASLAELYPLAAAEAFSTQHLAEVRETLWSGSCSQTSQWLQTSIYTSPKSRTFTKVFLLAKFNHKWTLKTNTRLGCNYLHKKNLLDVIQPVIMLPPQHNWELTLWMQFQGDRVGTRYYMEHELACLSCHKAASKITLHAQFSLPFPICLNEPVQAVSHWEKGALMTVNVRWRKGEDGAEETEGGRNRVV